MSWRETTNSTVCVLRFADRVIRTTLYARDIVLSAVGVGVVCVLAGAMSNKIRSRRGCVWRSVVAAVKIIFCHHPLFVTACSVTFRRHRTANNEYGTFNTKQCIGDRRSAHSCVTQLASVACTCTLNAAGFTHPSIRVYSVWRNRSSPVEACPAYAVLCTTLYSAHSPNYVLPSGSAGFSPRGFLQMFPAEPSHTLDGFFVS